MVEVNLEVSEPPSPFTELASSDAASSPALAAAKAALTDIATNPANPRHAGYHRIPMDPETDAHINALYKKGNPSAPPPPVVLLPAALSQDQREALEDAQELEQLKTEWEADGGYEAGLEEATEVALLLRAADPKLYLEAARRLGDPMALRLLRLLRQRVNL